MKRISSGGPPFESKEIKLEPNVVSKQSSIKEKGPKFMKKASPGKKKIKDISKNQNENISHTTKGPAAYKSTELTKQTDKKPFLPTAYGRKMLLQKKNRILKKQGKKIVEELPDNLMGKDGKPKWDKVKEEKEKLKKLRKINRSGEDQYELSKKAKSLWEKLRRKKHNEEKRETLVNDLFMLLKGQIPNVVHSHDMARVVQWMLKLGSPSIRTSICEELCANTVSYLQSKYASFCVKSGLRYGSKADRNHLIQSCSGNFLKLLGYSFAIPVVEAMYNMFASAEQRKQMHREVHGEMHVLIPPEVTAIVNIPENMRPAILAATKTNLTKLLAKKQLLKSTFILSILNDFLASCSGEDRNEMLEFIHGDILELLNTKEGSRVALQIIWHGTNKMKKVIVKSLKGKVKEIAMSEIGHIVLMALFDCIDDTVLVKKALVPELLCEAEELVKNELGRKVILYLVAHRDPAYFHPQQMEILSKGDAVSSRKKDASLREQEMLEAVSTPLLQKISDDPVSWFGESSVAMVSLAVMKSGKGETLRAAFESLISYILNPSSMVEINSREFHVLEDSAMNLVLKKLIQLDQSHPNRTTETFSKLLARRLTDESLNHILQFNRGCFLLVFLFESKDQEVCKILKSKITNSMTKFIQKQETTGSKILLKKVAED